jgi:hypothetical protein
VAADGTSVVATAVPAARQESRSPLPARAIAAVCAALVLAASPYPLKIWSPVWRGYFPGTVFLAGDLGILILLAVAGPAILRARRAGPAARAWLAISVALAVAYPFHPSGRGVLTILHLLGAAAIAAAIGTARQDARRAIAWTACAVGVAEAALAIGQRLAAFRVGLGAWFEAPVGFYRFGGVAAPNGSFPHPYVLAAAALCCTLAGVAMALDGDERHPLRWAAAAAVCEIPIGLTCSRDALLGLAILGVGLVVTAHRRGWTRPLPAVLVVLALGAAVPAAATTSGWLARASTSTTTAGATDGRAGLARDALTLLGEHPVTGVGPGRYMFALESRFHVTQQQDPQRDMTVHDLPLAAGVEGGLLALGVALGALGWIGWRALRAGPLAVAVFGAFLPFVLLDQLAYSSVQGVLFSGLWLGVVDVLVRRGRDR